MGRPRTHRFWNDLIHAELDAQPTIKASTIRRKYEAKIKNKNLSVPAVAGKLPDERTIRRIISEFPNLTELKRKAIRWVQWPQSMERGELPWEASRAVLDLLRFKVDNNLNPPTNQEALWFWRVSQAAPALDTAARIHTAILLMNIENSGQPQDEAKTSLQWSLAYEVSLSNKASLVAHDNAYLSGRIPRPLPVRVTDEDGSEDIVAMLMAQGAQAIKISFRPPDEPAASQQHEKSKTKNGKKAGR